MQKSMAQDFLNSDKEGGHTESTVLKKLQAMIAGIPPPISVTMSKLTVSDMLTQYKENEETLTFRTDKCSTFENCKDSGLSTPLVYYLNSSQMSEEIANLFQKVQSRYIYLETLSSCNIWFDSSIKANSAKKNSSRRSGLGLSPGSRLSHLARRRQAFSCESLQQLANFEKRRHIEIKKNEALKNRTLEKNSAVEYEKVSSFKRALFLSPEDGEKTRNSHTIKRNLFLNFNKDKTDVNKTVGISTQFSHQIYMGGSSKKRRRTESREGSMNWPRRALTFTEEDSNKTQERRNAKVMSELELSLHHKSKLLWAVSLTMKEKNMSSKDPNFKTCASALFMICRKNLAKILTSKVEGGTSEKMLHFAKNQIDGIFKKLGISSESKTDSSSHDSINDANSSCSEQTKDNSMNFEKDLKNSNGDLNCSEGESPFRSTNTSPSITEKENIDCGNCLN